MLEHSLRAYAAASRYCMVQALRTRGAAAMGGTKVGVFHDLVRGTVTVGGMVGTTSRGTDGDTRGGTAQRSLGSSERPSMADVASSPNAARIVGARSSSRGASLAPPEESG